MYTTTTVKQILDRKGYDVWSIDADSAVIDALILMAEKNIGALLVNEGAKPIGIFSERDYARKLALKDKNEHHTQVKDVMTTRVIGVLLHQDIDECIGLMTGKFIRHLPVINEVGEIVGIISIGDVVKELIADQVFVIDQLVNYIIGEKPSHPVPEKSDVEFSEM